MCQAGHDPSSDRTEVIRGVSGEASQVVAEASVGLPMSQPGYQFRAGQPSAPRRAYGRELRNRAAVHGDDGILTGLHPTEDASGVIPKFSGRNREHATIVALL
jgi:hypothetical protein